MADVRDRVALVTGASSEIGGAIAETLARMGCRLSLTGRDEGKLRQVAGRCQTSGESPLLISADLTEQSSLEEIVGQSVSALGGLDILVNNAGIFDWASAEEADFSRWDELLDLNLRASMRLTRLALPYMLKNDRGVLIFIASMAGRLAFGHNAAYVASKHGLVGFAGSVFEDVRDSNVKVCAICPGLVNAGASLTMDAPQEVFDRLIQPQDVAQTVSEAVRFVVNASDTVCATEIRLSPQRTPFRT